MSLVFFTFLFFCMAVLYRRAGRLAGKKRRFPARAVKCVMLDTVTVETMNRYETGAGSDEGFCHCTSPVLVCMDNPHTKTNTSDE